jgi:hypothetical protein
VGQVAPAPLPTPRRIGKDLLAGVELRVIPPYVHYRERITLIITPFKTDGGEKSLLTVGMGYMRYYIYGNSYNVGILRDMLFGGCVIGARIMIGYIMGAGMF